MKSKIEFNEFLDIEKKLEIRVGTIMKVEEVPKSNKLLKLIVSFGGDEEQRTVVTNIKPYLTNPKGMENSSFLFITNLNPTKIMGIESTAIILPGGIEKGFTMITVNANSGDTVL